MLKVESFLLISFSIPVKHFSKSSEVAQNTEEEKFTFKT